MATRDGAAWPWEGFGAPPSLAGVGAPPRRGAPALTLALAKPQPTATPYAKLFPVRIGVGGFRAAAAPSTKGKPLLQLAAPTVRAHASRGAEGRSRAPAPSA